MNLNSFRLKLALLAGSITGLLLVGSGFVLWRVSYRFNRDQLDREIRHLGQGNLDRVLGTDHWKRLDEALRFIAGEPAVAHFLLWVQNYDRTIYRSPDWPADLAPPALPAPPVYETPDGTLAPGSPWPEPPRRGEAISAHNPALPRKLALFATRTAAGRAWRLGVMGNPYVTLVVAADVGEFDTRMSELRRTFLIVLPVTLMLAASGAWLVARRALRPVAALTQTAERVTARGLDQRIPATAGEVEFNRLITVFNAMLDRLEKSFLQASRFSADASHELKTPLARLQAELEQALASAPPGSPQETAFSSLLEEVQRLKAIVQKLLLLSLADAGRLQLQLQPVDLGALLANVVEDCRALAPALAVAVELAPGVCVRADAALLEQALQNLATNAVKYNRPGGQVRFALHQESGRAILRVENTGPCIPPADHERIFERFYRVDPNRSGQVAGTGLGLSLAREIVRAHGGDLWLQASDANWTRFEMTLAIAS